MADKPQAKEPEPHVVAKYVGDGSTYTIGIPNRDLTKDDQLTTEQIAHAVKSGTHEKPAK